MPISSSFFSDGLRLAADLHLPDRLATGEPRAAIVLCHGSGGLRRFWFPECAAFFNAAGYVVLAFVYRGTGDSEGPPLRLDPQGQVADIRHAVSFLATRPEVDPERIGLYCISYGSGNTVYAAAVDTRIKAITCVVGYGDGERWLKALRREWEWVEFEKRIAADQRQRALTVHSELIETSEVLVRDLKAEEHEREARAHNPDRNVQVTIDTGEAIIAFKPGTLVDRIAPCGSLFIGVAEDTLVPTAGDALALCQGGRTQGASTVPAGRTSRGSLWRQPAENSRSWP
ncbi:MAG: alpha/beta fold hydrolase [Alphaproteobacteria bacterium]|nr:alpha/beta fold hydrolase [Alphaproteobacteria bacterium]